MKQSLKGMSIEQLREEMKAQVAKFEKAIESKTASSEKMWILAGDKWACRKPYEADMDKPMIKYNRETNRYNTANMETLPEVIPTIPVYGYNAELKTFGFEGRKGEYKLYKKQVQAPVAPAEPVKAEVVKK